MISLRLEPFSNAIGIHTRYGPEEEIETTESPLAGSRDTKLLIYGLFQKGRVLAQDGAVTTSGILIPLLRLSS